MTNECDLKTFYKTRYIYPITNENKLDTDFLSSRKISKKDLLPFLKRAAVKNGQTIYSSPSNSLNILTKNRNTIAQMTTTVTQQMITVYKDKIRSAIKSRKAYEFLRGKIRVYPTRKQSNDGGLFKSSTMFSDTSKECIFLYSPISKEAYKSFTKSKTVAKLKTALDKY